MIKNKINKTTQEKSGMHKQAGEHNRGKKNTNDRGTTTMEVEYEDVPDMPHPHEVNYPSAKKENSQGKSRQEKHKNINPPKNKKKENEISEKSPILTEEDEEDADYDEENQ